MIAKVLLNRSFEATLRYVFKPDAVLIDTNEPTAALSLDPHLIAARMNDMARGRSSKPCYHIALSPHPTDSLLPQDWKRLGRDFLSRLGLSFHPRVTVLHTDSLYEDKPRPHLHFVISRYESSDCSARAACLHFPQDVRRSVRLSVNRCRRFAVRFKPRLTRLVSYLPPWKNLQAILNRTE